MENNFSIIIVTHNRPDKVARGVNAALTQTYANFEVIVIDDGSQERLGEKSTFEEIRKLQRPHVPLTYVRQVRQQRLIARNAGMRLARHDWILLVDDDDEILPTYLEDFNKAINENPDHLVFASSVQFYKIINGVDTKLRVLKAPKLADKAPWPHFRSGCITMGQFIFKKECLNKTGYFPHTHLYGDFAIDAGIPGYGWLPPQPPRFPKKRVQVLGNPFGDDFYIFYKLTRHYDVSVFDKILLKKNCR